MLTFCRSAVSGGPSLQGADELGGDVTHDKLAHLDDLQHGEC